MFRMLAIAAALSFLPTAVVADDETAGLVDKLSAHSVEDTADRLEAALEAKGLKVFARIDHAGAAEEVGQELRPLTLVIFGNPKSGTALMQKAPTAGIDLPLKAVIYETGNGAVYLSYNTADYVMDVQLARHGLFFTNEQKAPIAAMLEAVSEEAVQ